MKVESYTFILHCDLSTKIKNKSDLYVMEAKWTLENSQYLYTANCIDRQDIVTYVDEYFSFFINPQVCYS